MFSKSKDSKSNKLRNNSDLAVSVHGIKCGIADSDDSKVLLGEGEARCEENIDHRKGKVSVKVEEVDFGLDIYRAEL